MVRRPVIAEVGIVAQFGRFRLNSHRRELLADGVPVAIGGRALDILIILVKARGELVTRDELMNGVWPGMIVEVNTLQFQICSLRKALGPDRDFVKTISGRGYRFVAETTIVSGPEFSPGSAGSTVADHNLLHPTNLPSPISDLVGREALVSQLVDLVAAHRLVTLVGAGGIGKTRLGLEVARRLLPKFADGVWVVELAPLSDPDLVLPTLATVLGLAGSAASPERLAAALTSKHLLLILDNCEHLIGAAARTAETLLHAVASVQIIATSREPLRAHGECIYRVPSLDVPADDTGSMEELLQHSAVKLFISAAHAAEPGLSLDAGTVLAAATICRHLDGIPLAIELAAASAAAIGVGEVASRLDDRFALFKDGHRTALLRHQTLRATHDWSYGLLVETERLVLHRLAIFAGGFGPRAASAIAASAEIAAPDVIASLASLVAKSLVVADIGGATVRYRLHETTRAYALEKLVESGEYEQVARSHAEYYRDVFALTEAELETRSTIERLAESRRDVEVAKADLRAAKALVDELSARIGETESMNTPPRRGKTVGKNGERFLENHG